MGKEAGGGVRHRITFDAIKNFAKSVFTIFVDANPQVQNKRYVNKGIISYDEFLILDNHPVELETEILKPLCDSIIDSTANYSNFLSNFIDKIR